MTDESSSHLIEMANQIAANLAHGKEQSQCIIDITSHLRRFWAPSMRQQLLAAIARGDHQIHDLVIKAARQLSDNPE